MRFLMLLRKGAPPLAALREAAGEEFGPHDIDDRTLVSWVKKELGLTETPGDREAWLAAVRASRAKPP